MTIVQETITLDINGRSTTGHLAKPEGEGAHPAVVVIQEWWGLTDDIKEVADRFAAEGFVALAPDFYFGEIATEPDEARKLLMQVFTNWQEAMNVLQTSVNVLLAHPQVSSSTVGVTGFCMGGGLTWHGAAKVKGVGAAVPFYGGCSEMSDEEVAQIACPVLAIFGELDEGVSPAVARARAEQMDKANIQHETIIYPDAHHAFFNDTRPIYNEKAAADAWGKMITLFNETLA